MPSASPKLVSKYLHSSNGSNGIDRSNGSHHVNNQHSHPKTSNDGKAGQPLQQPPISVGKSSTKATKLNTGKTTAPHQRGKQQRATCSVALSPMPVEQSMSIDNLYLDVPITSQQLDDVLDTAQYLKRKKILARGSTKGTFFKHAFVLKLDNGGAIRFFMVPNVPSKGANMHMVLNPNHVDHNGVQALKAAWMKLFPLNYRELALSLRLRGIDVCVDTPHAIDDLIIDLERSSAGGKVFVWTDRGGQQQTVYVGSKESAHHGVAYDQRASDQYKRSVGEVPSRTRARDDAELILEPGKTKSQPKQSPYTRIESRLRFDKPLRLSELQNRVSPLGKYKIYDISQFRGIKLSLGFMTYIDCVRLRGIGGARLHLIATCPNRRVVRDEVSDYEAMLRRQAVPWWSPQDQKTSMLELLQKTPVWEFLRDKKQPK